MLRTPSSLLVLLMFVAPAAYAAAEPKIAYVDMSRALNDVDDAKGAKDKLKTEFDAKQKRLDKQQTDFKAKKDEYDARSAMMKPDVKLAKQEELQKEFAELQQTYMQLQKELMDSESKATAEIAKKLKTVIAKIGDRDGYDMIVDIGETFLYYKRHQEITDQVVKEYNKQYGGK